MRYFSSQKTKESKVKTSLIKTLIVAILVISFGPILTAGNKYGYTVVKASIWGSWDAMGNPPDPYVIIKDSAGNYLHTGVIQDNSNPVWNFSSTTNGSRMKFHLYDKDMRDDDYIGTTEEIDLSDIKIGKTITLSCGQATLWIRRDN